MGGRTARQPIIYKSRREIELMRNAGRLVFEVHQAVGERVRPGVDTAELNEVAEEMIAAAGAEPLFKGVENKQASFPFPAALCISVNDEVVHGIPSSRTLREGDIVSVDCGVRLKRYCGDAATTHAVGQVSPEVRRLLDVTRETLALAIAESRSGVMWSSVAREMQRLVESNGFSVVREFVGHGIGQGMHEEPKVPNFTDRKQRKNDYELRPGLTIAVEPMVNMGTADVAYADASKWTVVTKDGGWAAHYEHTIAVTTNGADVLTDGR
jgi:methionyl aminopeptidase